jgi:hypothetical protein
MIPSGYKEDIVYSAVPTDGSGDLSFTRASNGTRINSAGLVEVCPWNLLQQSETFDNAYWNLYQATITSNTTTAPNGTTTADTLNSGSGFSGVVYTSAIFSAGDILTLSIYAKANTSSILQLGTTDGTDRSANFNLSTGVVVSSVGVTASIESVGNGWYRCSVSRTMLNPANFFVVEGTGSLSLFIWGAQTNVGVSAKPYFPTTDRLNVPRLTYQNGGGGCPSLLLEKQSTNLVQYSEQFDVPSASGGWSQSGVTITANTIISPDGTQNADTLYSNVSTYVAVYETITTTNGATYTASVYAKKGNQNFLGLELRGAGSSPDAIFNLNTGVVVSGTGTIENVGNGWYRCSITIVANSTSSLFIIGRGSSGAVGDTVYIWGAQLEASSYPTSYIPTTSASATRVADDCKKTGISSLFGTNQGTFFMDFLFNNSGIYDYLFDVTDSSNTQRFLMYDDNGSGLFVFYDSQNSVSATMQLTQGQRYKIGVKYNSSGTIWYVNGILKATGYASFAYQMSQIYLGQRFSIEDQTQIQVNQTIVFPTALSGTDLIALTTI